MNSAALLSISLRIKNIILIELLKDNSGSHTRRKNIIFLYNSIIMQFSNQEKIHLAFLLRLDAAKCVSLSLSVSSPLVQHAKITFELLPVLFNFSSSILKKIFLETRVN